MIKQIRTNVVTLHQLKTNLYKAESAQRGYLYTKRDAYIEPFNKAISDARDDIDRIEIVNYTAPPQAKNKWKEGTG